MGRPRPTLTSASTGGTAGQGSGNHQGLHRPADDQRVEHALDHVGLDDRGESLEDHLRDRRSKGLPDAYDDAVDHAATRIPA